MPVSSLVDLVYIQRLLPILIGLMITMAYDNIHSKVMTNTFVQILDSLVFGSSIDFHISIVMPPDWMNFTV